MTHVDQVSQSQAENQRSYHRILSVLPHFILVAWVRGMTETKSGVPHADEEDDPSDQFLNLT